MKLLYNTSTQQLQPYPRGDDESVVGLDPMYEVYGVIQEDQPVYDPAVNHLEAVETIFHATKTVSRGWAIIANTPMPAPPAAAYQVRAFLIRKGIKLNNIPAIISASTTEGAERDEALMRWEFVTNIPKDHPLVSTVATLLGIDRDAVWESILTIE